MFLLCRGNLPYHRGEGKIAWFMSQITDQVFYDVYVASETSFREFDFDGYTYRYVASKDMEGVETPALVKRTQKLSRKT